MSTIPPQVVVDAIESGSTQTTRRVEFYEYDGVTPWLPDDDGIARLIDGSVNLDYGRSERRTLDISLDNIDNALRPDPLIGLWYDKVIKPFRGVKFWKYNQISTLMATNLVANPSFELDAAGWASAGGTVVQSSAKAFKGSKSGLVTKNGTAGILDTYTPYGLNGTAVTPGETIGFSARTSAAVTSRECRLLCFYYTSSGAAFTTQYVNVNPAGQYDNAAGFSTFQGSVVVPAGVAFVALQVTWNGCAAGEQHYIDCVSICRGIAGAPYFDGDTSKCKWQGTPHASFSSLYQDIPTRELATWEVQMGEFVIDRIDEDNYPHITKITARDYTKRCLTSKTEQSMSFPQGTNVGELIRSVAANAGITKFRLYAGTEILNTVLAVERGTERWKLMNDVAASNGYELFFDNQGYLVMRKFLDPSSSPLTWTFMTGSSGNLVKWSRSTNDSRLYNQIVVTGESGADEALPFYGEALNVEPSSPTYYKRIGTRTYFYTSSFFTSDQQCRDLANSWLKVKALESYESSWDSFNYPWMEVGEVVGFLDPRRAAHEPTRYLMDTLSIPLGLGPMTATAKRVTYVNDPGTFVTDTNVDDV